MFEKFTSAELPNFRQRYQGTFGFFRKGEKKILVQLTAIEAGERCGSVTFQDKNGSSYTLYTDSDDPSVGFEFLPPKCQYHNTKDGTYLVKRIPARQYLRGICDRNTSISSVAGIIQGVKFPILHSIYDEGVGYLDKYREVTNPSFTGEKSFALSSQFAVSLDLNGLFCLGIGIGTAQIRRGELRLHLHDEALWHTEIRDCLNRTKIEGLIV